MSHSDIDDPLGDLPAATADGRARAAALAEAPPSEPAVGGVAYVSRGRVLVLGSGPRVGHVLAALDDALEPVAVVPGDDPVPEGTDPERVVAGELSHLGGHLGAFEARVAGGQAGERVVRPLDGPDEAFDLVVDLGEPSWLAVPTLPVGYFAPGSDSQALSEVLGQLPELVGEFEKPRYFDYRADICAHGQQGQSGCTRCLDACSTGAIRSLDEEVAVDPYLCQGCGICATACPTGAITYTYPTAGDLLGRLRRLLRTYREGGGEAPAVLFHDGDSGAGIVGAVAADLPERVLPVAVEETPSVGMETWMGALAYGAGEVVLLRTTRADTAAARELRAQVAYAGAILEGLGYSAERIRLVEIGDAGEAATALAGLATTAPVAPAGYAALGGKRDLLRTALDHLHSQAPAPAETAPLPEGAPFGEVRVDADACTLCMACVSICPAGALLDGEERPQVRFLEGNCVQCGLCQGACPEEAISLVARMAYDPEITRKERVLHEEAPFHCIGCGQPFATRSMVDRMTEKLGSHWMYKDSASMVRRLQMCGDCRAKDIFAEEAGIDVHNKPDGSN